MTSTILCSKARVVRQEVISGCYQQTGGGRKEEVIEKKKKKKRGQNPTCLKKKKRERSFCCHEGCCYPEQHQHCTVHVPTKKIGCLLFLATTLQGCQIFAKRGSDQTKVPSFHHNFILQTAIQHHFKIQICKICKFVNPYAF